MNRPRNFRNVCTLPRVNVFGPVDLSMGINELVIMSIEEYESIRLMDLEGLNHEQCADVMGVARSKIETLYYDAHKKLADSVVNGKILKIEGSG